jgi:hypothetical protein
VTRHQLPTAAVRSPARGAGAGTTGGGAGPVKKDSPSSRTEKGSATKARRTPAETVALAARIKADRPEVTESELAAALGISASRWRTVRREAAQAGDLRLAA